MADKKKGLTVTKSMADFRAAYRAKSKLLEREKEDFLFALGEQWSAKDQESLRQAKIKPITDNRIAPNIFLLTGLERQNRSDFKAFPEGEEDSIKAEIASSLFKNAIKTSGFAYKSSDQFKDGVTCGESHMELYLDYTDNLLNGKPCWRKLNGNVLFPEPGHTEYDFSDCKYVYKIVLDIAREDLINIYPKKKAVIKKAVSGRLDLESLIKGGSEFHVQRKDYSKSGEGQDDGGEKNDDDSFDLIERYYKKWVETYFIGDKQTGEIKEADEEASAEGFIMQYKQGIEQNQRDFEQATMLHTQQVQQMIHQHASTKVALSPQDPSAVSMTPEDHLAELNQTGMIPPPPPPPPEQDPERYLLIKRMVPEIWCFAHVPGIDQPLGDGRAWFYPKWKNYSFVPYFARFSTAPLKGDEAHLLIQGVVHGVKGVQEKHNKAEMLMLRHLNTSANSGWDIEEDQLEDSEKNKLEQLGSMPGIVIERKKGTLPLNRLIPVPLSQGHAQIAAESAESIKAQSGINADLVATQQGGSDSGRAIALRQRQGLLMVQELFDNLSRSRIIAGKLLLSQLGEIFDTETASKVLGEAYLIKTFPPVMQMVPGQNGLPQIDPATGQPVQQPVADPETGEPMKYDKGMAETAIAEVLSGELEKYDVAVGESVSSETQKMANSSEVKEIAQAYPGLIPPDVIVEESLLPQSTKNRILSAMQQQQQQQEALLAKAGPGDGRRTPGNLSKEPAQ